MKPALAYRFDFKDRSIAFSGDTAPLEAVAKMAKGADVLVHETMYVPAVEKYIKGQIAQGRPVKFEAFMEHMKADHTPSEDVGRIAQRQASKRLCSRTLPRRSTASATTPGASRLRNFSRARSLSART